MRIAAWTETSRARGRLVADDDARLAGERAGDRDPLLEAARELGRAGVQEPLVEAHRARQLADALVAGLAAEAGAAS